ncbi:hypothetical protein TWF225_002762 [Orbilia oligospora]|nr:hypothetical protein TWF751_003939 [Orbilia oligospora]KAF3189622.1 hypothetical protein TWF225_002762 [Orbilia oligospora]KAF3238010.1 hypothetical protein TWF217_001804 [Orbilia oligospora]KAF3253746.1 hypothetical protein TWF128_006368 [Orbilia oligospora]KAF3297878.1 hypothetical protein TWF132_004027 [Orbilia oligospora]
MLQLTKLINDSWAKSLVNTPARMVVKAVLALKALGGDLPWLWVYIVYLVYRYCAGKFPCQKSRDLVGLRIDWFCCSLLILFTEVLPFLCNFSDRSSQK